MVDQSIAAQRVINSRLIESGEKERLKERLKKRLTDCGWKDDMKARAKAVVAERGQQITVEEIVLAITPHGRDSVPTSVKQELLAEIKDFWEQQSLSR